MLRVAQPLLKIGVIRRLTQKRLQTPDLHNNQSKCAQIDDSRHALVVACDTCVEKSRIEKHKPNLTDSNGIHERKSNLCGKPSEKNASLRFCNAELRLNVITNKYEQLRKVRKHDVKANIE